jgi:hypothetical protein
VKGVVSGVWKEGNGIEKRKIGDLKFIFNVLFFKIK